MNHMMSFIEIRKKFRRCSLSVILRIKSVRRFGTRRSLQFRRVLWKGIKESTEFERSAEPGGRISLHLPNLPNIGCLVDILADAYRLLEQAGLAAKLVSQRNYPLLAEAYRIYRVRFKQSTIYLRSSCRSARGDKTWVSGVGGR